MVVTPGKTPFWVELPRPDSIEITCDTRLLGKTLKIPVSFNEFVEGKNSDKATGNSGKTNRNSIPNAEAETLLNQGLPTLAGTGNYVGVAGTAGRSGNRGKATCKKHPEQELSQQTDGRYYCKSCKKRVAKADIEYR